MARRLVVCFDCDSTNLRSYEARQVVNYGAGADAARFEVRGMPMTRCRSCGAVWSGHAAAMKQHAAIMKHLRRLHGRRAVNRVFDLNKTTRRRYK